MKRPFAGPFACCRQHALPGQVVAEHSGKVTELQMPRTVEDAMPGTRMEPAWYGIPYKKYYAAFAGNAEYPLAVFAATGKRLSGDDLNAQVDTRGLWVQSQNKKKYAVMPSPAMAGSASKLDLKSGIPLEYNIDFEGTNQPNDQVVGVYNAANNEVLFLDGDRIAIYDAANAQQKDVTSITLHWGRTKAQGIEDKTMEGEEEMNSTPEAYNYTSILYTGIAGAEIGVLNTFEHQVELYNIKTGFLTQKLKVPSDLNLESSFNFAYANGIYWFFSIDERKWIQFVNKETHSSTTSITAPGNGAVFLYPYPLSLY